ncbi:hypothetical protein [Microcystis phage Mwe-JY08]
MTIHHDLHMARLRIARLEEALRDARENIEHWGGYAGGYIQDKWDLKGDIAAIDDVLGDALTPPASSPRPAPETKKEPRQDEGSSGAQV